MRKRALSICIWVLGLLTLSCVRPAGTVEAVPPQAVSTESEGPSPSLSTAEPKATPLPTATEGPRLPVAVMITAVPTPTPTITPTPSPTPEPTPTPTPSPIPAPFEPFYLPTDKRPARFLEGGAGSRLFYWPDRDLYLAYGQVGNKGVGFYPADERGNVERGADRVEEARLVPLYTPAEPPTKEGEKLLVLYLPSQSVVSFHGENGEWREDRIMICSSGRGNNGTPVGKYTIYERYDYKLLGSEEEDTLCFGFWACRFYKGHLFHSVPISYDAGYDKAAAHHMTNMRSYQKLGTKASHGCVRMTVADAKYIYDLSQFETVNVWVVRDQGPTPPGTPKLIWSEPYTNKQGYGWDPTDPDPNNPYLALSTPAP